MSNFKYSCVVLALIITGCAAPLPGKKIDEGGRFMQSEYGDFVMSQIDFPTPAVCSAELLATTWNNHANLKCGKMSAAERLPYGGSFNYLLTGMKPDIHFRTSEQCEEFKRGLQKSGIVVVCTGIKP